MGLFYDIPRVGAHFDDMPSRDAVLRQALVGTQFYRSFTTCLVGTQFYNMPSRDAVVRHALVGTQLYDMP